VKKSRRMRYVEHVSRMGEMRNANNVFVGKPEGRHHSEYLGIDGWILLEWILVK
jgi:hypothetical protein